MATGDPSLNKLVHGLSKVARNPADFPNFVDYWNSVFEVTSAPEANFNELDEAVDETFRVIVADETQHFVEPKMKEVMNALPHAGIVVQASGMVSEMNEVALSNLPIAPSDHIDAINYQLEGGKLLSDVVRDVLVGRNSAANVSMLRAVHTDDERIATMVFMPKLEQGQGRMMLFIIDPRWRAEIQAFLARAFELTPAESSILKNFLEGYSLKEIAQDRGTTLKTVRTQFQTIMNKAGVGSQAELMRNALAISQFFNDMEPLAQVARHPYRKSFAMIGKGGRTIDVTLAGRFSGDLVVSISDMTLRTYTAKVEREFYKAGICVASLSRPGTGQTDPPEDGQDYLELLAQDICALADQLDHQRVVLMGANMASVFVYRLAGMIGERLKCLVVKSTLLPTPDLDGDSVRSAWAKAFSRAVSYSPKMYRTFMYAAIKAWKLLGSRRMFQMQLKGFEPDMRAVEEPDAVVELDQSVKMMLAQGPEFPVNAFELASGDWSDAIENCEVPIFLLQGRNDPALSYNSIERFAQSYPEKIELRTIEGGGYLIYLTHTQAFVNVLKEAAEF